MPGYKAAKGQANSVFGDSASPGNMKLKPFLVYRSEDPKLRALFLLCGKVTPKAWVTQAIFQDQFIPEVRNIVWRKTSHFNILSLINTPDHPSIHG